MNAVVPLTRYKLSVEHYHRMHEAGILSRGTELIEGEVLDMREGAPETATPEELLDYMRHRYSQADFQRLRRLSLIDDCVHLIDGTLWSA
ncbi:MAG TPA: hypothetical protein VNX47_14720 [Nevskia sp.]|jgi:hypothetical protein|nr:hypothetical protein [Nevskia sp.]